MQYVVVGNKTRPCSRIYKYFDGNHYEREGHNNRIYHGVVGWRWAVEVDGQVIETFELRRQAISFAENLRQ